LPAAPAPGWPGVLQLVRNHAILTVAMLGLAIWRIRRVHLGAAADKAQSSGAPGFLRIWRPRLGNHAMLWKELFAEQAVSGMGIVGRVVVVLLFLGILAPIVRLFYRSFNGHYRPQDFQELVSVLATVVGSLFLLVIAARASTSVTSEKEKQCWDTLISTPLSGWEIVIGKTLGNAFALRWLMALFGVMWAMAVILRSRALVPALLMTLTIALVCPFFVGLGLYFSLRSRNSTRAMCWSLLVSVFVGGGYLMFAAPLTHMLVDARIISWQQQERVHALTPSYLIAWAGIEEMRREPWALGPASFAVIVAVYLGLGACLFLNNILSFDWLVGRPYPSRTTRHSVSERARSVGFTGDEPLIFSGEPTHEALQAEG
jgi:ABC-type transport system involved in multi-copper enzyme maturation permease subunit